MSDASFLDPIADILNFTPEQKTMFTKDYNRDISTQIVILSGLSKEELLPIASIKDINERYKQIIEKIHDKRRFTIDFKKFFMEYNDKFFSILIDSLSDGPKKEKLKAYLASLVKKLSKTESPVPTF